MVNALNTIAREVMTIISTKCLLIWAAASVVTACVHHKRARVKSWAVVSNVKDKQFIAIHLLHENPHPKLTAILLDWRRSFCFYSPKNHDDYCKNNVESIPYDGWTFWITETAKDLMSLFPCWLITTACDERRVIHASIIIDILLIKINWIIYPTNYLASQEL